MHFRASYNKQVYHNFIQQLLTLCLFLAMKMSSISRHIFRWASQKVGKPLLDSTQSSAEYNVKSSQLRRFRSSTRLLNQSIDKFDNCCFRGGSGYRRFFKAREYFLLASWNVKFFLSPSLSLVSKLSVGLRRVEGRHHTHLHLG